MEIAEYQKLFPNENVWRSKAACVAEGMLLFDHDSAGSLAGPFEGDYAYYRITDNTGMGFVLPLEEFRRRIRFSNLYMPRRYGFQKPVDSEEHLQKRVALLTPRERKEWEKRVADHPVDVATIENPVSFRLAGNDDATWTKFFPSVEAAKAELQMLIDEQPLHIGLHIRENGFVFTN